MITLSHQSKWQIVDGTVQCQRGHVISSDADFMVIQGRRRCRRCHRERNARSARSVSTAKRGARDPVPCRRCGVLVPPARSKFCSALCLKREAPRVASDRLRAAQFGAPFEPVYRREVYERDGWICQLCRFPVAWFLEHPNIYAAVLDHRVPLAKGGGHVWSNVQLAHANCNQMKGAMGPEEFAAFMLLVDLGEWEAAIASA